MPISPSELFELRRRFAAGEIEPLRNASALGKLPGKNEPSMREQTSPADYGFVLVSGVDVV